MSKIILTGASGSGKTSTLSYLSKLGYNTMPEVARPILKMGISNVNTRQTMMLYAQIYEEQIQPEGELVFLDRGVWDYVGFSNVLDVSTPLYLRHLGKAQKYDKVFCLDSLPVFEQDGTRIEGSQEESNRFLDAVVKEYKANGFTPINVPVMSVEDRATYILENIVLEYTYSKI